VTAASVEASWVELNALLWRLRNTPIAPTTITITSAVVCSAFPTAKAAVNENTMTAVR
jgi:hypothetical protein